MLEELRAEIAKLTRKQNRNSSNSSSPPSKDVGPKNRHRRRRSGRKPGGQRGHVGHWRKKLPDDQITTWLRHPITEPCVCGHDDLHERRYATSIDVMGVHGVTRHQPESGRCNMCRRRRTAALPAGVTRRVMGTDLLAASAFLTGVTGASRRKTLAVLADVLGKRVSLGTLSTREEEVSEALKAPMTEIHDAALAADVKHLDETGHRKKGLKFTSWVLSTSVVTVLFLGLRRGGASLAKVLKGAALKGIAVTDRYAVYERFGSTRQLCLEHIRRNFLGLVDVDGVVGEVAQRCASAVRRVLIAWRDHRTRRLGDEEYRQIVIRCRQRIRAELRHSWQLHPELKTLAYVFFVEPEIAWRFFVDPRVPPTNNQGERDIRELVVRRKVQLHTWSERGDRYVERTLSISGTCRKLSKSPYDFLVAAIDAKRRGVSAPRLLLGA